MRTCPSNLIILWVAVAVLLQACSDAEPPIASAKSLDVFVSGQTIHRLVGDVTTASDESMRLTYQRSSDGGSVWTKPTAIDLADARPAKVVSRGEDAQVAAHGETVVVVWPGRGGGIWGSGPLGTAVSHDRGQTWTLGPEPAVFDDDGSEKKGARFPALTATAEGFHLVWIDASDEKRSVRYSRSDPAGSAWSEPQVIDATSCACCWNEIVVGKSDELVFVYRDESPRDMKATTSRDGGDTWGQAVAVGDFQWEFDGCPHVGSGLSIQEDTGRVHASVWSGKDGKVGVYALYSDDAGGHWSSPNRLGSDRSTHPRIIAAGNHQVVACWTENLDTGPQIQWAVSSDEGESWSEPRVIEAGPGFPSHALLTHANGTTTLHWTQENDESLSSLHSVTIDP